MKIRDPHWLRMIRSRHRRPTRYMKQDIVDLMDYIDNLREGYANLLHPKMQQLNAQTKEEMIKAILNWTPDLNDVEVKEVK